MDFALTTSETGGLDLNFEPPSSVQNNVILSLQTRLGSLFSAPAFGSRLHELKKNNARTRALIPAYVLEAVKWMIDLGRIMNPEVTVLPYSADKTRALVRFSATLPSGPISFDTFVSLG